MKLQYINNKKAREITGISQAHTMSKLFSKWVNQGLIEAEGKAPKFRKYRLPDKEDLK